MLNVPTITVTLDEDQIDVLRRRSEKRGTGTPSEYVTTLVEQFVARMPADESTLDESVEAKLQDLGYL